MSNFIEQFNKGNFYNCQIFRYWIFNRLLNWLGHLSIWTRMLELFWVKAEFISFHVYLFCSCFFFFFAFFTWWWKIKKQWFSNKTFDIFCNFDKHWHWAWDYYQSLSYNAFSILFKIFVSVNHLLWIGEAFLQKLFLFWIKSQSEKYLSSVSSDSCSSSYSSL